ncbi:RecQ family ATP-dependent DNA helicase [Micrococcus flavus]|uniref:DNA 3'-5' helicase n=1 Tax=Micrococcus flavus TaxID=384602 RepID=A0A4Y8X0R4_9MICC|nr:RecQ family ATP-dependent DNA helicase [Micrococcus flavus]MBB4883472.1 ATP-dependent DNA helicase RecQ [Micrococcus flavus]TFI01852.1 RecQ family ATP-dependent DNA helicase [Micrococcus flavus]GGK52569.1 ATP-dependent DNA helicase RecQ [Micrococcus flavus]
MSTPQASTAPSPSPAVEDPALHAEALKVLRDLVGRPDAEFKEGQYEAVEALVAHRRRALVVQRTGWGKSAVYFVASLLLRARGAGPTLIVSPLLALMRDQVAAAARAGVRAVSVSSANATEWEDVRRALAADEVDVLLISPERLTNPRFRDEQLPDLVSRMGLLVVDEAHCISDWGHDFRPDYRRIRDLIGQLPSSGPRAVPVLATTATANGRVVQDVVEQLDVESRQEVFVLRGPLARASLRLGVLRLPSPAARLAWLLQHLQELPGSGIVYALTVSAAEDTARALRDAGVEVVAYTGRTDPEQRERIEEDLKANRVKAVVATSALGMGFDKPDLTFVVHLGAPSSPVAYYQQVGRAGRGTDHADVLLLPGQEDRAIWEYFATASMPDEAQARAVLDALQQSGGAMSVAALEPVVSVKRTVLELLLKVLAVDGAVERVGGGWRATGRDWTYDAERYARVAEARRAEERLMLDYQTTQTCRMEFLARTLDDPTAAPCGRCDVCAGPWFPTGWDGAARERADQALRRTGVPIEPRRMWPSNMDRLGVPVKGRIAEGEQAEEGRALARLTDLGWGSRLRELLAAEDAPLPEEVLQGAVAVLAAWGWQARPIAVVAMPSRGRPQLVDSFARGIARLGRLPFLGALETVGGGPTAGPGGNSAYRLASVHGRFAVPEAMEHMLRTAPEAGQHGPVLLVDDLVDSRWSLAEAARVLRGAGAQGVLPFVLAQNG